jgi:hypothetical protein
MPVFGLYMKLCRTVFVDPPPASGLTNRNIILEAARMLRRENMNLLIFPVDFLILLTEFCIDSRIRKEFVATRKKQSYYLSSAGLSQLPWMQAIYL